MKQLGRNVVSGSLTTITATAVVLVSYPVYLRYCGYSALGIWLVLSTVISVAQAANLGLGQAVTKLVAEELGRSNFAAAQAYVWMAMTSVVCIGGAIAVVIAIGRTQIASGFSLAGTDRTIALALLPYAGLLTIEYFLSDILTSALAGSGRIDLANYARVSARIVDLAVSVALLRSGWGVKSLLIGDAVSLLLLSLTSVALLSAAAHLHLFLRPRWSCASAARLFRFGGATFSSSLINMFIVPVQKLLVSRYAGVASVPVYEMAYTGSMALRSIFEAGLRALLPEFSRWSAVGTDAARGKVSSIYAAMMRLLAFVAIPVFAGFLFADNWLLRLWLRSRFTPQLVPCFNIMLLAALVNLVAVPSYYLLFGIGRVRQCVAAHVIIALASIMWYGAMVGLGVPLQPHVVAEGYLIGTAAASVFLIASGRNAMRKWELSAGPNGALPSPVAA